MVKRRRLKIPSKILSLKIAGHKKKVKNLRKNPQKFLPCKNNRQKFFGTKMRKNCKNCKKRKKPLPAKNRGYRQKVAGEKPPLKNCLPSIKNYRIYDKNHIPIPKKLKRTIQGQLKVTPMDIAQCWTIKRSNLFGLHLFYFDWTWKSADMDLI